MERKHEILEKSLISAALAGMFSMGLIAFFMRLAGVSFDTVNGTMLMLGYVMFSVSIWCMFMFPQFSKA